MKPEILVKFDDTMFFSTQVGRKFSRILASVRTICLAELPALECHQGFLDLLIARLFINGYTEGSSLGVVQKLIDNLDRVWVV